MAFPIVVLISGQGSNLQAIIDAIATQDCHATIKAVISNRKDAYGLERASQAGIITRVVAPLPGESRLNYDQRLYDTIKPFQPQLLVLAGFMRILTAEFVAYYPNQMINIHPSLLPKYPGLNTHEQVLENHDPEHGITIHLVTDILDSGPILCQVKLTVHPWDTIESLKIRIHQLEHYAYPKVIDWFASQRILIQGTSLYLDHSLLPPHGRLFDMA